MELILDGDLQKVVEFMQRTVPAEKLVSISEVLPLMGRLLWSDYPQKPLVPLSICELQPTAIESVPEHTSAGDGSAVAVAAL